MQNKRRNQQQQQQLQQGMDTLEAGMQALSGIPGMPVMYLMGTGTAAQQQATVPGTVRRIDAKTAELLQQDDRVAFQRLMGVTPAEWESRRKQQQAPAVATPQPDFAQLFQQYQHDVKQQPAATCTTCEHRNDLHGLSGCFDPRCFCRERNDRSVSYAAIIRGTLPADLAPSAWSPEDVRAWWRENLLSFR